MRLQRYNETTTVTKCISADAYVFDNSAQIIADLTAQFKATPDGTYGYFYEEWNNEEGRIKEEHPIIQKLQKGKKPVDLSIPQEVKPKDRNK